MNGVLEGLVSPPKEYAQNLVNRLKVLGGMDILLPPFLIKKGADLPLLLIFIGVVGGLIAFGIIGLFVGPVVLAVAQKLLWAWVDEETAEVG